MITYVIPTRNREHVLHRTLHAISALGPHEAEVVVVDNASDRRLRVPDRLESGVPLGVIRREENEGAAARNIGARVALGEWVVMLDDDSYPTDLGFLPVLSALSAEVSAVSADITLPKHGARESGGLPEVFIGCGVAIRRDVMVRLGGYDPAFGYYAEEYDLAARILLMGGRVHFEPRFRVAHLKDTANRDISLIVERLVRNNGWVAQRYAPEAERRRELRETRRRYRAIAGKEGARAGFARGVRDLRRTVRGQIRTPMSQELFDRFTGISAARQAIGEAWKVRRFRSAAIIEPGKNEWAVHRALAELGVPLITPASAAEAVVIGTLSPGPLLDAAERHRGDARVVVPWAAARRGMTYAAAG